MVSSSLHLFLFVLFTLHFGTHGQEDAMSDDHCIGGLRHNVRRCAKGCTFGFAAADSATAVACGKNSLKPALLRCKKPAAMKKTKVQDYSIDLKCDQCRAGWDGDLCTRENIARKRVRSKYPRLQDDDPNTCLFINGTKPVKLKRKRESASIVDLFLSSDANQKANFDSCMMANTGPCKELAAPSEKVIRLNCSKPSKQPKQLIIDCTARLEQLHLCEVKVYACDTFWFGAETGCSEPCNCQDGVSCNPVTGACPPGKEVVQLTSTPLPSMASTTSTQLTSTASTTSTPLTSTPSTTSAPLTSAASTTSMHIPRLSSKATSAPRRVTLASSSSPVASTAAADTAASIDSSRADSVITHSTASRWDETDSVTGDPVTGDRLTTEPHTPESDSVTGDPVTRDRLATEPHTPESDGVTGEPVTGDRLTTEPHTPESDSVTGEPVTRDRLTTESHTPESYITDIHPSETDSPDMTTVRPATAMTMSPATPPVSETQTVEPLTATTSRDVSGSLPVSVFTTQPSTSRPESRASSVRPTSQHTRLVTTITMLKSTRSLERDIDMERKKKKLSVNAASGGESSSGETNLVPVMVGILVLVLLIASALAGLIIHRNRRSVGTKSEELLSNDGVAEPDPENNTAVMQLEMKNQSGSPHSPPAVNSAQSKSTAKPEENVYANVSDFSATTMPVPVDKFRNHVSHLNNVGGFQKEFEMLPRGILAPVLAADNANKGEVKKNRFKDISPYDEFRVVLSKEKDADSDYINATYIDGFAEVKAYIAAQGPLPDTMEDFWHMVWVEGCGKIVMLTNLCEDTKVKCEQYWPPHEGSSVAFGRYTITSIKVMKRAHFMHRVLDIAKDPSQSAVSEMHRQVHQFHFTAWTDHGVPCAVPLVHFWSTVTLQQSQLAGPLLVHCSAGIGRTGTFIALDILTHQVETTGQVSVFPTVQRLRKQRANMVQTPSQYRFLHEVLAEWLASRDSQLIKDDLAHGTQWTEEGQSSDQLPAAVREKFVHQFQLLDKLRPQVTTDQVTTAMLEENIGKNRSTQILPMEQYRVCLKTSDSKTSDYINAIFLPSLRWQHGYIVTQLPLEDTVSDFWRMVDDWGVKVIVRFMDAPKEQDVELYPLVGRQTQHGDVCVETRSTSTLLPGVTCYTIHLHTQISGSQDAGNQTTAHAVSVYCVDSPGALSLTNTATFLSLVKTLLALVTAAASAPVVFQCFDGAGLSCVMCALMMAAEALEVEGRVSPFLLTRLIHTAQPQAFKTIVQYEFLVRCLLHRARGITDVDDITESDENREVLDDTSHIYGNV